MSALHPDWPETSATGGPWGGPPDPIGDVVSALAYAASDVALSDLASVVAYDITSEDGKWGPGGSISTELSMTLLGTLKDGRWFALEAGNDYTGWGCMGDQADLYVGATREDVVTNGLTTEGRNALGIEAPR